ncbi:MAG: LapA family protein [Thermodesulfobacteriota bacterium]
MTHLKTILLILVGLVIIILAVQNNETMSGTVQLRVNPVVFAEWRSGNISLYQFVLVAFLLGVLSTGIYAMVERFRLKRRIKMLHRQLQEKDKELNSLRNLPLTYESAGPQPGPGAGGG